MIDGLIALVILTGQYASLIPLYTLKKFLSILDRMFR